MKRGWTLAALGVGVLFLAWRFTDRTIHTQEAATDRAETEFQNSLYAVADAKIAAQRATLTRIRVTDAPLTEAWMSTPDYRSHLRDQEEGIEPTGREDYLYTPEYLDYIANESALRSPAIRALFEGSDTQEARAYRNRINEGP